MLYADLLPRILDSLLLYAVGAVTVLGICDGASGECGKACRPLETLVSDRVVPDLSRFYPGIPAERVRDEEKSAVGDPRIDVHAAVVLRSMDVMGHVGRLRILSQQIVVVGGAWCLHRPQCLVLEG